MKILGIIIVLISLLISRSLKNKFVRYARTELQANLTGAEIAHKMLEAYNIDGIQVTHIEGQLTDHYNPINKTINLSTPVFHGRHAAAAAVAAHECGHAVQHMQGYSFFKIRSMMVPVLSVTTQWMPWIIFLGIVMIHKTLLPLKLGISLFSLITLFSFITLPVEFDASKKALNWIKNNHIVTPKEYIMAKDALWWAAMTYVIAALGSLAQLLHLLSKLSNSQKR